MKTKKIFIILFLYLFLAGFNKTIAQPPNWEWVKAIGSSKADLGFSITLDDLGNVYTTGYFGGTVDFNPGPGVFNLTANGEGDIFISKSSNLGDFIWAKAIGGVSDDVGFSITIDANGNVYTTGNYYETVDFDPGVGTFLLTAGYGHCDIFISKLDSSGNFIWAKNMVSGSSNGINRGTNITTDVLGNVYLTGFFEDTVDFDPGPGTNIFISNGSGEPSSFISKLDSSGNFVWARAIDSTSSFSIALDSSNYVYITGIFSGTVDMDPGAGTSYITAVGSSNFYLSKFDSSGNFIWAKATGGRSSTWGDHRLCFDSAENIYITGFFDGVVDFDPGPGIFNLTSNNSGFISKLDSAGKFIWAKSIGGNSLAIDKLNNVYIVGSFFNSVDFDPDTSSSYYLTSVGLKDISIIKIDSSGDFIWAKRAGGTLTDIGLSLTLDSDGKIYFTGSIQGSYIYFDTNTLSNLYGGKTDIIIGKLDTTLITGINGYKISTHALLIYPNPANDYLIIEFPNNNKKADVIITDIQGKIIYSTSSIPLQQLKINTTDFSEGMYVVKIQTADFMETKKFIVIK